MNLVHSEWYFFCFCAYKMTTEPLRSFEFQGRSVLPTVGKCLLPV